MSRILHSGEWYDEVSPTALYEAQFEEVILENSHLLFPFYTTVSFKPIILSEDSSASPDLALISKDYKEWWVVEVETGNHSFNGHVKPQVRTLSQGFYGQKEADYLISKNSSLDPSLTRDMLKGSQPRVLVIVNTPMPSWSQALSQFDVKLGVLQIFRSCTNRQVFRVNGDQPSPAADVVSSCTLDRILPGFLCIDSPATLNVKTGSEVRIYHEGSVSIWRRFDSKDRTWLQCLGANPLERRVKYQIVRNPGGELAIHST